MYQQSLHMKPAGQVSCRQHYHMHVYSEVGTAEFNRVEVSLHKAAASRQLIMQMRVYSKHRPLLHSRDHFKNEKKKDFCNRHQHSQSATQQQCSIDSHCQQQEQICSEACRGKHVPKGSSGSTDCKLSTLSLYLPYMRSPVSKQPFQRDSGKGSQKLPGCKPVSSLSFFFPPKERGEGDGRKAVDIQRTSHRPKHILLIHGGGEFKNISFRLVSDQQNPKNTTCS